MRRTLPLLLVPLIAGCVTAAPPPGRQPQHSNTPTTGQHPSVVVPPTVPARPPVTSFRTPQIQRSPGLEGVIEQNTAALTRQFGTPRLDVREGDARKLQFSGSACVLDVFLYPLRQGGEPVATYAEARRASDGQEVDRAACVQALRR